MKKNKVRVNISVDRVLLNKAKKRLDLFGGKLSTLFNAYLADFIKGINKEIGGERKELERKVKELEERIEKLENK